MTPEQKDAYDMREQGMSRKDIAQSLGISESAVKHRLERARKWLNADPAAKEAATVAGSNAIPHSFWLKTDTHSIYYKTPSDDGAEDKADAIADKFKDLPMVKLPSTPKYASENLLAFYAMADIHMGLRAWGAEVGEDYDTDIAASRVREGMQRLVAATPDAHTALIVSNGDSLHANDDSNETPQSRHKLDVDTRAYQVQDVAIESLDAAIQLAAQRHKEVIFSVLPGNHDRDAYKAILFALRERYRGSDRVKIIATPMEFFVHEFGKVMIACHHGDKAKADRLVMDAADRWPEMWGRTRHRFYFTGHLHHHKSQDIGGMQWEQLRAVTAKDAYASSHSYSGRSQMQSIIYDKELGEIQRHKVGW